MKKLAVGIDIGGTNSAIGLVDNQGNVYAEGNIPTGKSPDFNDYMAELAAAIKRLQGSIDFPFEMVGIGIGAPNANYYTGTIDNAANLQWKGILPVVAMLREAFPGIPVIMTNDANAAAVGEMVYGATKGMKDFILITLGTGLGSGFVSKGELIYGHDGFAGELGHMTIDYADNARVCGCGRRGCIEAYASAPGLKRTVFELLSESNEPNELRDVSYNELTAEMISTAANKGNKIALKAFDITGKLLGKTLANAVAVTSPEAIVLFGGLARAGKLIFEPTQKYMEENMMSAFKGKVKLIPSGLEGKNVAVLGASALIWQSVAAHI